MSEILQKLKEFAEKCFREMNSSDNSKMYEKKQKWKEREKFIIDIIASKIVAIPKYVFYVFFFSACFLWAAIYNANKALNYTISNDIVKNTTIVKSTTNDNEKSIACSICGKQFTGNGYEEVSDGIWKLCSSQALICSPSCGMKHTTLINGIINSNRRDGKIYETTACPLCNGTGIEKNTNHLLSDEDGRVCPMCEGKGVRSY